jgi:hypothetical protein
MFKFALAFGIAFEWIFGSSVASVRALTYAALHTLSATLLAWMILESGRTLFLAAMSLDGTPPRLRQGRPR